MFGRQVWTDSTGCNFKNANCQVRQTWLLEECCNVLHTIYLFGAKCKNTLSLVDGHWCQRFAQVQVKHPVQCILNISSFYHFSLSQFLLFEWPTSKQRMITSSLVPRTQCPELNVTMTLFRKRYIVWINPLALSRPVSSHVSAGTCFYKSLPRPFVSGNN